MKLAPKILAVVALLFSLFVAWEGLDLWKRFTRVQQQMDDSVPTGIWDCLGTAVVLVPVIAVIVVLRRVFRGAGANTKPGSPDSNVPKQ
ncbi:MAG: hypothetical protein WCV00_04300 [Verrucomicrobiia bacterium]|jgi:TRAP-type C4-dicarboxylate transport system permease small subunit